MLKVYDIFNTHPVTVMYEYGIKGGPPIISHYSIADKRTMILHEPEYSNFVNSQEIEDVLWEEGPEWAHEEEE